MLFPLRHPTSMGRNSLTSWKVIFPFPSWDERSLTQDIDRNRRRPGHMSPTNQIGSSQDALEDTQTKTKPVRCERAFEPRDPRRQRLAFAPAPGKSAKFRFQSASWTDCSGPTLWELLGQCRVAAWQPRSGAKWGSLLCSKGRDLQWMKRLFWANNLDCQVSHKTAMAIAIMLEAITI